jgi:hypothetical protein
LATVKALRTNAFGSGGGPGQDAPRLLLRVSHRDNGIGAIEVNKDGKAPRHENVGSYTNDGEG